MSYLLPKAVFEQHIILLGKTRSGKSSVMRLMIEHLLDEGEPVCIIDPKGDWWGLKSSADGKHAGYPIVIFGGEHGDVPLNSRSGAAVAELTATGNRPCIIDLGGWMPGARTEFWIDFASKFFILHRGRRFLAIDEVHNFCLSSDTELLTKKGWKSYREINLGDEAVCFDLETQRYLYGPVERLIQFNHEGPMVHLYTDGGIDSLTTTEHRVVMERYQRAPGRYKRYSPSFCAAGKLPNQTFSVPIGGAPIGDGIPGLCPAMCELLGMVISDGWFINDNGIAIQQSIVTKKKQVKTTEYLRDIIARLGGGNEYKRCAREHLWNGRKIKSRPSIVFYLGAPLSKEVQHWLGRELHRIPRKILCDASLIQLEALYKGLMMGDGSCCARKDWVAFFSGAKQGLDGDFQELCLRLGKSSHVAPIVGGTCVLLSQRQRHWIQRNGIKQVQYSGPVWDITVPTGAFVVRRKGKIFVTGNCPKGKLMDPSAAKMLHWSNRLASEGLGKGIALIAASQRPQKVHNDFLTSCETLLAMRVIHKADRDALKDWVDACGDPEQGKEVLNTVASMKRGEGWCYSPEAEFGPKRIHFSLFSTYDSFRPQRAAGPVKLKGWADVDLAEVTKKLEAAVKEAEANDPTKLKARIRELQAQLEKKETKVVAAPTKTAKVSEAEIRRVLQNELEPWRDFAQKVRRRLVEAEKLLADAAETGAMLGMKLGAHRKEHGDIPDYPKGNVQAFDVKPIQKKFAETVMPAPKTFFLNEQHELPRPRKPMAQESNGDLPTGEAAILKACAQYPGGLERSQLTVLTAYKKSSRDVYIGKLKSKGLLDDRGGKIYATEAGMSALGSNFEPLPERGEALQRHYVAKLPEGEKRILQVLIAALGEPLERDKISEATGYLKSSRDVYIGKLIARELVKNVGRGQVKASETLFA